MKPITLRAHEVRRLQAVGEVLVVRKVKGACIGDNWYVLPAATPRFRGHTHDWWLRGAVGPASALPPCPLGTSSEQRWVRETWNTTHISDMAPGETLGKSSEDCARDNDGFACACGDGVVYGADGVTKHPEFGKALWRSSATMPRWASRFVVEISDVLARQVQSITEAEAIAAGVCEWPGYDAAEHESTAAGCNISAERLAFARMQQAQDGPDSWSANPWVWLASVRRVEA